MGHRHPVTIVLAIDDAYVKPAIVTLFSLATSGGLAGSNVEVWVLHTGIQPASRQQFERAGEAFALRLFLRQVSPPRAGLRVSGWISPATYLRLSIPSAFPSRRWALYLDADLVAVQGIGPLLDLDLSGSPLGAVRDTYNPVLAGGLGLPGHAELGLRLDREYFNSGVMKLDLECWREQSIARRALRFAREHPENVRFWDQCALNWAIDDCWFRLPLTWNAAAISVPLRDPSWRYNGEPVLSQESALEIESSAHILHFSGRQKPWHADPRGCPSLELYGSYMRGAQELLGD